MIPHPRRYAELFDEREEERVIEAAVSYLVKPGMLVESRPICERLAEEGAEVSFADGRVRWREEDVWRLVRRAPASWVLRARNPDRSVRIGEGALNLAPGYGSAFVADAAGIRRPALLEDLRLFLRLGRDSDLVDLAGGLVVEPTDVPQELRPLEVTLALLTESDKPIMGSVAGAEGARESLEAARIVFDDLDRTPAVLGLININSPLRLDSRMAAALSVYAEAGQPLVFTPGIMMGITAPVTPAGALAQAFAELLGCVAVAQTLRPGLPVIVGTGGFGADLRNAGPGFGRPEQALGTQGAAQLARRLRLPYRSSAMTTGAFSPDCRAGYESMLTAFVAWQSGVDLCLQGLGILDCVNTMSYEKFLLDLEVWGYIRRFSDAPAVDDEALAVEDVLRCPDDYMATPHTLTHFRSSLHVPALATNESYESWVASGCPDARSAAAAELKTLLTEPQPLAFERRKELLAFAESRRRSLVG